MKYAWIERVIWSPKHGGCLMVQRRMANSPDWKDWSSAQEGEFPAHDNRARHAVKFANANLKAQKLIAAAKDAELRAIVLRQKAHKLMTGHDVVQRRR